MYSSGFSVLWYEYRYHVPLCIGQLHTNTVYRTGFWGGCFSHVECHYVYLLLILDRVLFHHNNCDYYWDLYGQAFFNYTLSLSLTRQFSFCKCAPPWMFPPLDIPFEYWIEHVTFWLRYVRFRFSTEIFYKRVPTFATDCPCGVWYHGLTTYLLYVGSLIGNLVRNDTGFVSMT